MARSFATGHSHWCFICENPRVITTCDGWKRHMKEHMTRYRCMPRGPIEHTTDGAKCAFCGFHNPTQGHCDTHKAYTCANKSLDARSYTRKTHLLTHLKTHYISDGVELADHWRDRINKRHFSCGFCVSHFHTLTDQLNHIDIAHYRLFQHVREWDFNKVIRGLLLQPGVDGSWRRILASHPYLIESLFHWDFSGVKRLKSRLEMSDEPADTLAEAAFIESKYHWSRQGEAETIDATRLSYHGDADAPQPKPATQAAAPIPFDSSESTAADGESMTSSAPHSEQAGWPWAVPDTPISHRIHSLSRVDSDMSEGTLTLDMQHPYRNTGQTFSTSGGNIRTQPQAGSYTSCASPNTLYPNSATSSRVMEGDCWPATPILDPAKSSSLISSQPKQQNRRSVAKARNMFTNQHSSLTSGHHVSPSTQTSIPLAKPSHVSQPRKQPSRSKLKDHYDINTEADMDLDLDVLQRLMRDEESTRSEKRSR
ncbi:hypothetical protein IMSHALPRED_004666 [Imshaugia aleurites]|uniref:C2H2-type domain-containing protein n=1 Tax=Imshaugia aleurites TaxID=172621 RepID=A0A8H3ILC5_9LECA|nr:hypothetical protein IMSHALPRED_004666 [Imshaugia aleurites]